MRRLWEILVRKKYLYGINESWYEPTFELLYESSILAVPYADREIQVGARDDQLVIMRVVATHDHTAVAPSPLFQKQFTCAHHSIEMSATLQKML